MIDFVALDIETANENRSSLCSIGLVKVKDGKIVDSYYTLINPETHFDFWNIMIHGIEPEDVEDAPTFKEIIGDILEFIDGYIISAHFTAFDMYALQDVFRLNDLEIPELEFFCSYRLSRCFYRNVTPSQKLETMTKFFGINNDNHHNALHDAKVSALITLRILKDRDVCLLELIEHANYNIGILGVRPFRKKRQRQKKYLIL